MGSARASQVKPIPMETTNRRSLKSLINSIIKFPNSKKVKPKNEKKEQIPEKSELKKEIKAIKSIDEDISIVNNFNQLSFEEKPVKVESKDDNEDSKDDEEDELKHFTFKVIEEPRNERIHSQSSDSSGDSGFSDNKDVENLDKSENLDKLEKDEQGDDLVADLEKLEIGDGKKEKKMKTVVVPRGPLRNKSGLFAPSVSPYTTAEQDRYNKISSINKHTLSGGQVLVNQCQAQDSYTEVDQALESLTSTQLNLLDDILQVIYEDTNTKSLPNVVVTSEPVVQQSNIVINDQPLVSNTYLTENQEKNINSDVMKLLQDNYQMSPESMTNQVDFLEQQGEFTQVYNDYVQNEQFKQTSNDGFTIPEYTYPTPPRSETIPSPMSASPASFYPPSSSDYNVSPNTSPIYNSDYEKYQDIPHFEEEKEVIDKARERTNSISSMTMKQFKDMQREIVNKFSKRDCCSQSRKSCKEIFQEHMSKLKPGVKKNVCIQYSKLDLKDAHGVLKNILLNLSSSTENEDVINVQYMIFSLLCDRVLAQDPAMFVGEAGLSLLKAAAFRCPDRPLFTRYLVQCIRTVIKSEPSLVANKEFIFHEVDLLGDNLVIGCARAGDRCSDVLSELVRPHDNQPPLFRLHHTNADGYTALHVACSQHSAASPRLHTVHVLTVHAGLVCTDGDLKGGDTALHMAVNSAHCDLELVLVMFNQFNRKEWKSLAHTPNLSTKTPLDLARLAAKTTARQNYPQEVLDFLKKCR